MKIAMFGGTFDPIHNAHLMVAAEAANLFALDQVLFIPAAHPPHKNTGTSFEDRFKMVELACADFGHGGDPRFVPSRIEQRAETSYSIDTIERLKPSIDAAGGALYFIIGADAFEEITTWRRWREVVRAVEFIVVARPGHIITAPPGTLVNLLETLALPVSSSEIRRALAAGENPRDLPATVAQYIRDRGLYRR